MFRRALLSLLTLVAACRSFPDPLDRPTDDAGAEGGIVLAFEPEADASATSSVLRLRVRLPEHSPLATEDLLLFSGELSSYHLRRISNADLPNTLLERLVPSTAWREDDTLVLAPSQPLAAGVVYSLASTLIGLIGTLRVTEDGDARLLTRIWPPQDGGQGAAGLVFCGDAGRPHRTMMVRLDPGGHRAELRPGAGRGSELDPNCAYLVPQDVPVDAALVVPPPAVAGFALDPTPIAVQAAVPVPPASCETGERPLGLGCATPLDDRLVVRSADEPLLWMVRRSDEPLRPVEPGARFVVTGFSPSALQTLEVVVLDDHGRATRDVQSFQMDAPRPHVVINEVLANAVGPEPAQEWVELVNDGGEAVELSGWVLQDVGGETALPSHRLMPGEFAVVVGADYEPDPFLDVPPAEGSTLLRVERVGKNGLANSGEPLRLRDPEGQVRSAFLGLPASEAGVSVARRYPWSLDDDPDAYLLHGGEGASPGAPNQLP